MDETREQGGDRFVHVDVPGQSGVDAAFARPLDVLVWLVLIGLVVAIVFSAVPRWVGIPVIVGVIAFRYYDEHRSKTGLRTRLGKITPDADWVAPVTEALHATGDRIGLLEELTARFGEGALRRGDLILIGPEREDVPVLESDAFEPVLLEQGDPSFHEAGGKQREVGNRPKVLVAVLGLLACFNYYRGDYRDVLLYVGAATFVAIRAWAKTSGTQWWVVPGGLFQRKPEGTESTVDLRTRADSTLLGLVHGDHVELLVWTPDRTPIRHKLAGAEFDVLMAGWLSEGTPPAPEQLGEWGQAPDRSETSDSND